MAGRQTQTLVSWCVGREPEEEIGHKRGGGQTWKAELPRPFLTTNRLAAQDINKAEGCGRYEIRSSAMQKFCRTWDGDRP